MYHIIICTFFFLLPFFFFPSILLLLLSLIQLDIAGQHNQAAASFDFFIFSLYLELANLPITLTVLTYLFILNIFWGVSFLGSHFQHFFPFTRFLQTSKFTAPFRRGKQPGQAV